MPQGQFPAIVAGQVITAALLEEMLPVYARKDADSPARVNNTLSADPDLFIPLAANGVYHITGYLFASGATLGSGDLLISFAAPTGSLIVWTATGYGTSSTAPVMSPARNSGSAAVGVNGGSQSPVEISAFCANGSTAGNFALSWAENTTNATGTVLKRGSWLLATRSA